MNTGEFVALLHQKKYNEILSHAVAWRNHFERYYIERGELINGDSIYQLMIYDLMVNNFEYDQEIYDVLNELFNFPTFPCLGEVAFTLLTLKCVLMIFPKYYAIGLEGFADKPPNKTLAQWMDEKTKNVELSIVINTDSTTSTSIYNKAKMVECRRLYGIYYQNLKNYYGCDLHVMSELPQNLAQYKLSYLFIKKQGTQALYFIKSENDCEIVTIDDFKLFEKELNKVREGEETKLHLSTDQIQNLITSNGGHTRQSLDNSSLVNYKFLAIMAGSSIYLGKQISYERPVQDSLMTLLRRVPAREKNIPGFDELNQLIQPPITGWMRFTRWLNAMVNPSNANSLQIKN